MESKLKAKEIFDYCCSILANGVAIDKEIKAEAVKEIEFMIDTD